MPNSTERTEPIFRRTERAMVRLSKEQTADTVHSFRTTTRRLQTLLEELIPSRNRNHKKLLKALNRLRKAAGKVRDIDVQLSALRTLKAPLEPRRKTRLIQELLDVRARYELKLHKLLKKQTINEIHKRLKRAAKETALDTCRNPLLFAREMVASVRNTHPADEDTLHRHRIAIKRARYAAEFASSSHESKEFIAQLKRLQDALGNWHDWFTLTRSARDLLGDVTQSSLVAALHNITRAKFRQAAAAVSTIPTNASDRATPQRKPGTKPSLSMVPSGAAA